MRLNQTRHVRHPSAIFNVSAYGSPLAAPRLRALHGKQSAAARLGSRMLVSSETLGKAEHMRSLLPAVAIAAAGSLSSTLKRPRGAELAAGCARSPITSVWLPAAVRMNEGTQLHYSLAQRASSWFSERIGPWCRRCRYVGWGRRKLHARALEHRCMPVNQPWPLRPLIELRQAALHVQAAKQKELREVDSRGRKVGMRGPGPLRKIGQPRGPQPLVLDD